jgi:hypothetical protein
MQSFFSIYFKDFVIKCFIALLIPNCIIGLLYYKTEEFKYFVSLIKNIIYKKI